MDTLSSDEVKMLCRLLRQVDFLSQLSLNEIEFLISGFQKIKIKKAEVVVRQGEVGDNLYLISSGRVSVWANRGVISKSLMAYLVEGQFFGEMALLDDQIRKATVVADSDCEFYVLFRDKFWEILMANPAIEQKIKTTFENRRKDKDFKAVVKNVQAGAPGWLAYRFRQFMSRFF